MKHLIVAATTVLVSISVMASAGAVDKKAAQKQALLLELTGQDVSKVTDKQLYGEIYQAFQHDNEIALKSRVQSLLTRFPQSEYADNALYLVGMMELNHRNYAEALKFFSRVEKNYPNGNKAVSARFAKGMTLEKMNLGPIARDVLQDVKKKYPGSPESFRAEAELKIIK